MSKFDLDSFGEIIDQFLKENEVKMLLTLPEGTLDVQVMDNTGLGSVVVRFYILLNAIGPICGAMLKNTGIDGQSKEWEKTVDTLLGMVKKEILEMDPAACGGDENVHSDK